jgi:superfamily II DNA or RNA helicase
VTPWPPQLKLLNGILDAIQRGRSRICGTLPTGGGKSWVVCELVKHYLDMGQRTSTYTNRRLLIDQLVRTFNAAEIDHGVRAAGRVPDLAARCQISSIHTEHARTSKSKRWELHKADIVIIDECHLFTNPMALDIIDRHAAMGAVIVGFTATPLDIERVAYEELVVGGVMSDLRACGACVPAIHYGCGEPDLKHIGRKPLDDLDDLSENENRKLIMVPGIFGRVFEEYQRLNPEGRPTILFAPGVGESLMFAEYFHSKGVSSAHIDGEEVWRDGTMHRSNPGVREDILEASRRGAIRIICNRFVLREGIDCPWLAHGIFATVFGSLQSYLQSGGRLLRAHPDVSSVTIQDHGGNWHRHGSLNEDRHWQLGDTAKRVCASRTESLRAAPLDGGDGRPPREPVCCPQCHRILVSWRCPCGFLIDPKKKSRPVIQADGSLIEMPGDVFVPRKTSMRRNTDQLWQKVYWQARNSKKRWTFSQALGYFYYQNHYYPPPTLRNMPLDPADIASAVADVAKEKLHA